MNIRASVAMAVYNGERYLRQQIDSVLAMMGPEDELVISYEESADTTLKIIKNYEAEDSRVRVVFDSGHSVESNFNYAVAQCKGKYIFLADQDDVWIGDKINKMVEFFEKNPKTVVLIGNGYITNEKLEKEGNLFDAYHISTNPIRNFVKGTYLGCQMAFRTTIRNDVWPVNVEPPLPHDLWLGVRGAFCGKVDIIDQMFILHRLHESNYSNTSKMTLLGVFQNRILFLKKLLVSIGKL